MIMMVMMVMMVMAVMVMVMMVMMVMMGVMVVRGQTEVCNGKQEVVLGGELPRAAVGLRITWVGLGTMPF